MVLERSAAGSRGRLLGVLLAILLAAGAAAGQRAVEVYRPMHRSADSLLPLAETALAGEGTAVVDSGTNSLVIVGEAQAVADALALLALQDVAQRSVILEYESRASAELERAGVRVVWSVAGRSLRIGNVILPGGKSGAAVGVGAARARGAQRLGSMLRILDGQTGRISTGESRPVRLREGPFTTEGYARAETGLEATPRILSDGRIEVALRPFQERFAGGGAIEQLSAETVVVLTPGETVAVGGISGSGSTVREGAGRAVTNSSDDRLLLLRAEIDAR